MARICTKVLVFLVLTLFAAGLPGPSLAEGDGPLTMRLPVVQPYAYLGPDGRPAGFSAELAELLSTEIGIPIDARMTPDISTMIRQQASGQSQILPGAARLPAWRDSNLYSDPVAQEPLRLITRLEDAEAMGAEPPKGLRIGIIPDTAAETLTDLMQANTPVAFSAVPPALIALLSDEVDALLMPNPSVLSVARAARVDGRITLTGPALATIERVVALHDSRADLLPRINAAIARLEADGRLGALRNRHFIATQPADLNELVVGVADFPPHQILRKDGTITGFAVEVLRDLARQTDLSLTFKPIDRAMWLEGPGPGGYDLLPQTPITPDRLEVMDFTLPIHVSSTSIITRAAETRQITGLDSLDGLRVGLQPRNSFEAALNGQPGVELVRIETRDALFDALRDGDVDAIIFATETFKDLIAARGEAGLFRIVMPPVQTTLRAPALRLGLGPVRDRLNAAIPGYLIGERYAQLEAQFLSPPVFWTQQRIRASSAVATALLLLLVAVIALQIHRARLEQQRRRNDVAEAKARSEQQMGDLQDELETIFNATTSGIVALNSIGRIVRANRHARDLLGLGNQRLPMDWPKGVRFVDPADMDPLETSADPLMRALSGNHLHKETHLLQRADGSPSLYVRIDSAVPQEAKGDLPVVLVFDDISEEERNRHVVERRNRLDALGQLTGGIAHDFNNLLASMLYAIDLASSAKTEEKRAVFHATARSSVQRGRELTARLLSFARRQPGLASVIRVSDVFAEFDSLIRPMLEAKIDVVYEIEEEDLNLFCDPAQLESALMNLVLNSRDAMLRSGKGTVIKIRARPSDLPFDGKLRTAQTPPSAGGPLTIVGHRYVAVTVTDDGPGMDAETLKRSTDPFFTTKDINSGTGLGLAMVYGFAQQSNGDLMLYSEVGVGTTIQLVLPRGAADGLREAPVERMRPDRGHGERILLVEDEPRLLAMMSEILADLGYEVLEANSGQEAIQVMEDGVSFDLLLTDVVMPGNIGGFELAKYVRQRYPSMPVIYTSGYAGFTASEMGAVQAALIQKPASPAELAVAIENALVTPVETPFQSAAG